MLFNTKKLSRRIRLEIYRRSGNLKKLAGVYYELKLDKKIDWKNPKDLNEWINVLSFNYDTTLWSRLADKYAVREYVSEKGLGSILVPLYQVWKNHAEINFDNLPKSFVLKKNDGCGDVLIVKDKGTVSQDVAIEHFAKESEKTYGTVTAEPHYNRIKPCIFAEGLLPADKQDIPSSSLIDYKVWTIFGEPKYIMVLYNRNQQSVQCNLYDCEWNDRSDLMHYDKHFMSGDGVPKPKCLDQILETAQVLGKDIPEVRIDLYVVDNKVYFGEMTFTSNGGRMAYFKQPLLDELGKAISEKM